MSSFLASLSPTKSMSSASSDIAKFLVSKDKTGRQNFGSHSNMLRAIYNRLGRFGHVNPVSHSLIKECLKFTWEEQAGLAVTPKQAVPLFFTKFKSLIRHFRKKIAASASLSLVSKYILVKDAASFVVDFFTGDRASDLGRFSCNQVFR